MNYFAARARTFLLLAPIVAVWPVVSPLLRATNPIGSQTDATIAQLQKDAPAQMKKFAVPGISLALIQNGKTTSLQAFGTRNAKTNDPVTTDTIFEAASLSKPVFAYGVLKLVDQGKLNLDVPLTTYLPKPYVPDPRLSKITARIVLSHRTGFPNWRNDDGLPIYFTPGTRFSYSGEGYVYLQRVVEQITGKALNDYMTEAVFTPLGMTSSSYIWRPAFDAVTATGHDENGAPTNKWKPKPDEAGSASSLNTTARDYALFVEAILNHKGLKPATLCEMETPQIALDPACRICIKQEPKELSKNLFWGLGWGIQRNDSHEYLWHWGDNGSFKAFVMLDPKSESAIVLFANSEHGLDLAEPLVNEAMHTNSLAFTWLK